MPAECLEVRLATSYRVSLPLARNPNLPPRSSLSRFGGAGGAADDDDVTAALPLADVLAQSLPDAQRDAQRHAKYLLFYLHSGEHPHCDAFCRNVLASAEITDAVKDHFLFFPVDVASPEGHWQSQDLNVQAYPYVAMFVKKQLVFDLCGNINVDTLRNELTVGVAAAAPILEKEVAFVVERDEREMERRHHQRELEEAMKKDAEREAAQRAAAEERRRLEREAEEKCLAEQRAREAAEQAEAERLRAIEEAANRLARQKEAAANALPPPAAADEPSATIRLVSLQGQNTDYTFALSTPLHTLYLWAISRPEYDGRAFELVAQAGPRLVPVPDSEATVGETPALLPRSRVLMRVPIAAS